MLSGTVQMSDIPYRYTESGVKYIPGYTSFTTEYLNAIAYTYNIRSNRIYNETQSLPYDFSNIKIQHNELVTSQTINNKIVTLYKNYIHLLTRCKMAKSDTISQYRGPVLITNEIYSTPVTALYKTDYDQLLDYDLLNGSELEDVTGVCMTKQLVTGKDTLVMTTSGAIKLFHVTQTLEPQTNCVIEVISNNISDSLVDSNSDLTFNSIVDIAADQTGILYVLDSGSNIVYKYNMKGVTSDDRILLSKLTPGRLLVAKLGGTGPVGSETQFHDPVGIYYRNNTVYIVDQDTTKQELWLKHYDINLNYIGKYNISLDFNQREYVNMCVSDTGVIYILCTNGEVVTYDVQLLRVGDFRNTGVIKLLNVDFDLELGENYVDIELSTFNTNTIYVITNKTVYKKYIDSMPRDVGSIEWSRLEIGSGSVIPISISITPHFELLGDTMFILGKDNNNIKPTTMLFNCVDQENIIDLLNVQYEQQIYKLEDVYIKPDEYITAYVYNKMLMKMYYNMQLINTNLQLIASAELNVAGEMLYPGVRYISRMEVDKFNTAPGISHAIGINEMLTGATINRSLQQVYNTQLRILEMLQDRVNDREFYENTTLNLKRFPVKYIDQTLPTDVSCRIIKLN